VFDTILWNEDGCLTECTRGNIAVLRDGIWTTPSASCGLLAGVGRAAFLEQGRITEGLIRLEDLHKAQGLAFINSLRGGWMRFAGRGKGARRTLSRRALLKPTGMSSFISIQKFSVG
jgi:hypothetical protein